MIAASSIGIVLIPMLYVTFQSTHEWTRRKCFGENARQREIVGAA